MRCGDAVSIRACFEYVLSKEPRFRDVGGADGRDEDWGLCTEYLLRGTLLRIRYPALRLARA